jgi:hypothetical protein
MNRIAAQAMAILLLTGTLSLAQEIPRAVLADALRDGGYVIVMRHASSPRELPDETAANPENVNRERQLDATGRAEAAAKGMRASGEAYAAWLRANVAMPPATGNRLLITHGPNVSAAFPEHADGMGEGEALIFRPGAGGDTAMVARLAITDWPML